MSLYFPTTKPTLGTITHTAITNTHAIIISIMNRNPGRAASPEAANAKSKGKRGKGRDTGR